MAAPSAATEAALAGLEITAADVQSDPGREETLGEVQRRYRRYNAHAQSYTWKRTDATAVGRVLDMRKTLEENGVADDMPAFDALGIDEDFYVPVLHLYFSDDLTVA